jgi:predicted RNA binding protein YcfA (HicA-like mRNA interferase family)
LGNFKNETKTRPLTGDDGSSYAKIRRMKVRDVIKLIEADGWYLVVTKGSHRQYKHPSKAGRVTIAGHPGDEMAPGTLNSVLKQAQLREKKGSK